MAKRILVLQMCRLGDILQTTPMLRGLRRAYPDGTITLLTHDLFGHVPVPATLYDQLVPFPVHEIAEDLRSSPAGWPQQVERLRTLVADLAPEPYDVTFNLSHTDLSGLLSGLIPTRSVHGGLIGSDRRRLVAGPWMTYFWASQTCRSEGCFNLVDIQNGAAGVIGERSGLEIDISGQARTRMTAWLSERGLSQSTLVAVQLGASDDRKRWPADRFAAAIDALSPELGEVLLVGSSAERSLAELALARVTRPVHDAVGATTLEELAALLERCRLLITNDTGTMHVATAAGTRVVDLSTGPVFVHETGPYGEGHFVLQPRIECFPCAGSSRCTHVSCRDWIEPADVAALAAHALGTGPMPRPPRAGILQGRFTITGRIEYRTSWPDPAPREEVVRHAVARVWERSLLDRKPRVETAGESAGDGPAFAETNEALRRLAETARAAAALAHRLGRASPAQRPELAAQIGRHLEGMRLNAQMIPEARTFVAYLKVRLDSIVEQNLPEVARVYGEEFGATAIRLEELAVRLSGAAPSMRKSA